MTETTDMSKNETQAPAPPILPPLEERPLVTFAVFAYNQEDYIREAVEGAFSQTYEPLEIILSDDCSTDRTFEIMQEMAAAYEGPHEVRVRRNDYNKGIIEHINIISKQISGRIVVFAAGDDFSAPLRAEIIVAAFHQINNCTAVFSDASESSVFDISINNEITVQEKSIVEIVMNAGGVGRGATYAYLTDVLLMDGGLPLSILSEDKHLPTRAAIVGRVLHVNEKLIYYRVHGNSLTERLREQNNFAHCRPEHWQAIQAILVNARRNKSMPIIRYAITYFCLNASRAWRGEGKRELSAVVSYYVARLFRRISRRPYKTLRIVH